MKDGNTALLHFRSAGILIVVGAVTGAFGAHALEEVLDAKGMDSFETASRYAMAMGAALVGALASGERRGLALVQVGVWLFSSSIFLLVADRFCGWGLAFIWGPVTPIGGAMMIMGWLFWVARFGKKG
jgi:uncharacterized membrane protein YgdD (TMEM256/DUF423 family)